MPRRFAARPAALLAFSLALAFLPMPAAADCVPDPDPLEPGGSVVCSGTVSDGFQSTVDNVRVSIERDTIVEGGSAQKTIVVLDRSVVDNHGDISNAATPGGVGVSVGVESFLVNRLAGRILVGAEDAPIAGAIGVEAASGDATTRGGAVQSPGDIEVWGDGARGIQAGDYARGNNGNLDFGISNQGFIQVIGDDVVGIEAGSHIDAPSPTNTGVRAGVLNNAQIWAVGDRATGVLIGDDNTLENTGQVVASGVAAVGIQVGGGNVIVNSPGVLGSNSGIYAEGDADAVGVLFAPDDPGASGAGNTLINQGLIRAPIAVQGSDAPDTVDNQSDIDGLVDLAGGDDHYSQAWGSGFRSLDSGDGIDTLSFYGDAVTSDPDAIASIPLTVIEGTEILEIEDAGRYRLFDDSGSPRFSGHASVDDAYVEIDGEVRFAGDYQQSSDAVLALELRADGSNDSIDVAGVTTLDETSVLELTLADGVSEDQTFTVLTTGSFAPGADEFGQIRSLDSVLQLNPEYSATDLSLTVFRVSYESLGRTENDRIVGAYLDDTSSDASGAYALALTLLDTAPNASGALSQLNIEGYDAQTSTAIEWGRKQTRILANRAIRCERYWYPPREGVVSLEPCGEKGWTPWAVGLGYFGKRDNRFDHKSFDANGGGLVIGTDYRINDRFWLAMAVGGGAAGLDIEDGADGTFSTLDVGTSAGVILGEGELHGVFGYSHGWHKTNREIDFLDTTVTGKYGSTRLSLEVGGSYRFEWRQLFFEPLLEVNYTHFREGHVVESAALGMQADIPWRSNDLVSTTGGLRFFANLFKYAYMGSLLEWADGIWRPELNLAWRQVWTGVDRDLTASFVGAPSSVEDFTVEAEDANGGLEFGASIRFQPLASRVSVSLGYEGFAGDTSLIHTVGLGVRVPF